MSWTPRRWSLLLVLLTVLAAEARIGTAAAADNDAAIADFYHGKRLRIIVGFGAGGGYDIFARVLARHLPRFIPGKPSAIVENRPGGSSIVAANALYNTEPKDGTVIGALPPNAIMEQALGEPVLFDGRKFNWLGSGADDYLACAVRNDSGVASIADAIEKQIPIATQAPGTLSYAVPALLNLGLGTKFKLVPGYASIPDQFLAVQKNEASGACQAYVSVLLSAQSRYFEGPDPLLKIIVIVSSKAKGKFLDGVPTAESLAKTDKAKRLFHTIQLLGEISYPYVVAPEVPEDRVTALRVALAATFADPDFIKDAARAGQVVSPHSAQDVAKAFDELLSLPPDAVRDLRPILGKQ